MQYVVTNFAYGTGPYLRTTELALALNRERESQGRERLGIIVPWVYDGKQRRIMLEEFGVHERVHPAEILLDAALGKILKKVFYGENTYQEALRHWVDEFGDASRAAHAHLTGECALETLRGEARTVRGDDIVLELARAPRIRYGVAPVYSVTFGYISEILEEALRAPDADVASPRDLMRGALALAKELEEEAVFHGLTEPGTFSYRENRTPRYRVEQSIPPTITPPQPNTESIAEGIYVTITGIPGLERLYAEAERLGLKLYSNDPAAVPGSEYLSPHMIPNVAIKLQFARSGWGSVWLSQLSGTPFVTPVFDPLDDPEIYFNNICIEKLGLGIVYRGESLKDILAAAERLRPGIAERTQELRTRFGTLDGNQYAARIISEKT